MISNAMGNKIIPLKELDPAMREDNPECFKKIRSTAIATTLTTNKIKDGENLEPNRTWTLRV